MQQPVDAAIVGSPGSQGTGVHQPALPLQEADLERLHSRAFHRFASRVHDAAGHGAKARQHDVHAVSRFPGTQFERLARAVGSALAERSRHVAVLAGRHDVSPVPEDRHFVAPLLVGSDRRKPDRAIALDSHHRTGHRRTVGARDPPA